MRKPVGTPSFSSGQGMSAVQCMCGAELVIPAEYFGKLARWIKTFSVRGYWALLFFIAFDVYATLSGSKDNVAHWAHLGGFICGMVIAVTLLLTRQVDANGGDLLTLLLGRRAWKLLGTPAARMAAA
jgi:membrane associated rhomboid family serine protease